MTGQDMPTARYRDFRSSRADERTGPNSDAPDPARMYSLSRPTEPAEADRPAARYSSLITCGAQNFNELNQADAGLDLSERSGPTAVLAMRPWEYGICASMRK